MEIEHAKNCKGFTLIELILAAMILCMSVLAIGAVNTRSVVETRLNRQYEMATSLANRQLSVIDYIGIDDFLKAGKTQGQIAYVGMSFNWQVACELKTTGLYLVTVEISWLEGSKTYNVVVQTMMKTTSNLTEIDATNS